ncbi:unnamed protein product [Gadus morhua 'NCC']
MTPQHGPPAWEVLYHRPPSTDPRPGRSSNTDPPARTPGLGGPLTQTPQHGPPAWECEVAEWRGAVGGGRGMVEGNGTDGGQKNPHEAQSPGDNMKETAPQRASGVLLIRPCTMSLNLL